MYNFEQIDEFINENLENWKMSGLAVGVVKDNQVIFKKGYGYKDIDKKTPVETNSLFSIGSASKSFTSLCIAILIKRGLIDSWEDKVKKYIPDFETSCEYATEHMSIKDILSMRSGYTYKPYGNFLFYGSRFTNDEMIKRSKYIPFDLELRDFFFYENLNFIIAGKIVENVTGMTWHEFVKKEILDYLGMKESNSLHEYMENHKEKTEPHMIIDGKIAKIKRRNIDNAGSAGSIVSSVDEMVEWLKFNLSDGRDLVRKEDMEKMHRAHTVIDLDLFERDSMEDIFIPCYGLGWFVYEFNGVKCFLHGGSIDGYSAFNVLCPEYNLGIVILSNMDQNYMHQPIMRYIIDLVTNKSNIYNYNEPFLKRHKEKLDKIEKNELKLKELKEKQKEIPNLNKYCGSFHSKLFGVQEISIKNNKLCIDRFDWNGELGYLGDNEFFTIWDDPIWPTIKVRFIEKNDNIISIDVDAFGKFEKK